MRSTWIVTCLALLAHLVAGVWIAAHASATSDEVPHIGAGVSYLQGDTRLNREHPPLVKLMAAAALPAPAFGYRLEAESRSPPAELQWSFGSAVLHASGLPPLELLLRARLPVLLFNASLFGWLALWAFKVFGAAAACWAVALLATCPLWLSHASLVATDAPASALYFGCAACASLLLSAQGRARYAWTAALSGLFALALCTKYSLLSALGIVPFAFAVDAWRCRRLGQLAFCLAAAAAGGALGCLFAWGLPPDPAAYLRGVRLVGHNHRTQIWAWRWPRSGFAALWACAILAPTSSVLSIHTEVGAERRFYLPLIGVLGALGVLACALLERRVRAQSERRQRAARAALVGLGVCAVLALALVTRQHALAYRGTRTFWQAAVRGRPDNARAHYNLAETLRREGAPAAAIDSLRSALALQDGYAEAHINLSGLLVAGGAPAEGLQHAERGAAFAPRAPNAHYNLALACAFNGLTERALAELERTVSLQPQHTDARRRLAQGYLALGRTEQAREHARLLLQYVPGDALAQRVLSTTHRR